MKIYNIQYGPSMMVVTEKDPSERPSGSLQFSSLGVIRKRPLLLGSFPKGLSLWLHWRWRLMKKLFKNYSLHPAVLFDDLTRSQKETFCYLVDKKRGCQQGKQRRCQKTWQWVENCAKYIKPEKCITIQLVHKKY